MPLRKIMHSAFDALGIARRHVDIALVIVVLAVLLLILVELPPALMDCALVFNMTFSIVVLLTGIYVTKPLEFSVFPSLLLMATFYRLALNIATTRLILGSTEVAGDYEAAGRVIRAFGLFVAGDNPVVGLVIFAILVVIQFVVITKGASRISEVGARFVLDAMPGKQMSIDADLNAGLINEESARNRREEVMREADFYGAMDGVSKFVRGDAIAGIVITLVNIGGGLIIGMTQRGMSFSEAVDVFTKLTIGDGLVSQLPALIISVAAGLVVTRSTARADLGSDMVSQVFADPRTLFITSGFLLALVPSGLPVLVLLLLSALCAGGGYMLMRSKKIAAREAAKPKPPSKPDAERVKDKVMDLDPLAISVGYGLIEIVNAKEGGKLPDRISSIREKLAWELGFVVPPVRIRDDMNLKPNQYVVKMRGVQVAKWEMDPEGYLAMAASGDVEPIEGKETQEPAFGLKAVWIPQSDVARAEALGYTVVDPTSVMATHLSEIIRSHAAELLTREETSSLVERLKQKAPTVVNEVIPEVLKLGQLQKVLQNLLREGVSIKDLETILETLADWGTRTKDPEVLGEYVRHSVGRAICDRYLSHDGKLHAVTLDPNFEEFIDKAVERTERGSYLALSPDVSARIVNQVGEKLKVLVAEGHPAVVLCAPQIRYQLRRLLAGHISDVVVLSLNEIHPDVEVEVAGNVAVEV